MGSRLAHGVPQNYIVIRFQEFKRAVKNRISSGILPARKAQQRTKLARKLMAAGSAYLFPPPSRRMITQMQISTHRHFC
jgi:hypothetical protein